MLGLIASVRRHSSWPKEENQNTTKKKRKVCAAHTHIFSVDIKILINPRTLPPVSPVPLFSFPSPPSSSLFVFSLLHLTETRLLGCLHLLFLRYFLLHAHFDAATRKTNTSYLCDCLSTLNSLLLPLHFPFPFLFS